VLADQDLLLESRGAAVHGHCRHRALLQEARIRS
jgi:hypothetical protein